MAPDHFGDLLVNIHSRHHAVGQIGTIKRAHENSGIGEFQLFDDVLRDLVGTKAIDPATVGDLPEPLELRLMRAGGQALDRLSVYDLGEDRALVRRGDTRALIELTRRDARDLLLIWPIP